ncbi:hypothetical protein GPJ55_23155 [Bacillus subtilis]|nr:hypothetical protein GPJ55_23155 [Bacillus subtilis]
MRAVNSLRSVQHPALLNGLIEESLSIYRSLVDEREINLPAVRPYKDFIDWLQKQDQEKAQEFWKHYMSGVGEATPLPGDGEQASDEGAGIDQISIKLTPEMQQKLEKMTGTQKVTMSTLIQAAWGLLLHLHSGSEDVVFGVTVSGRPADLKEVESMTGLFINTLPLRLPITPDRTI